MQYSFLEDRQLTIFINSFAHDAYNKSIKNHDDRFIGEYCDGLRSICDDEVESDINNLFYITMTNADDDFEPILVIDLVFMNEKIWIDTVAFYIEQINKCIGNYKVSGKSIIDPSVSILLHSRNSRFNTEIKEDLLPQIKATNVTFAEDPLFYFKRNGKVGVAYFNEDKNYPDFILWDRDLLKDKYLTQTDYNEEGFKEAGV